MEGKIVNATGFTPSLGSMNGLPIAHVVYAHDALDGSVLLLECNNYIPWRKHGRQFNQPYSM